MVIVIGATGFIGLYTVEKFLQNGYNVLATGRNDNIGKKLEEMGAKFLNFDMTNKKDLEKLPTKGVEGIILLAGLLPANAQVDINQNENAEDYIKTNVLGTLNVLEYCRKNGIMKIISTSSYADVAKSWKKGLPLMEEEPRNFNYTGDHAAYVISKNAATDLIEYYNEQHGTQGSIFRLPPVYGVGPHSIIYVNGKIYKTGIQTFIENAEAGKDIEVWGDPHITRDIIYVKDVARAFVLALRSEKSSGLYNMTSGTELELIDQIKTVIEVFGKEKKSQIILRPDKSNNTPSFLFDMKKAAHDFDFIPEYKDYKAIMTDYKDELESGKWDFLFLNRRKDA